jgi:hypothetical protein
MRLCFVLHFLTLVVLQASAAPQTSIKPGPVELREARSSPRPQAELEPVQTTEVPENYKRIRRTFVSDTSINIAVGSVNGFLRKDHETESATSFGIQKSWYTLDETAQELGLAYSDNNLFTVDWGFKTLCCFSYPGSPYYKIGLAGIFNSKDGLGNFIDYQKYFLQGSIGLENLFSTRHQLRMEIGARYGYPGANFFAQFILALSN